MSRWSNFSDKELRCKCGCNQPNTNPKFIKLMDKVQIIRDVLGVPLPISSAYRCVNHPIEAKKEKAGWHNIAAVDIAVRGKLAIEVMHLALNLGIKGIGVNQKGDGRFIHLDARDEYAIWSY
ncbi:D-Ala-D-Ala carboxypeptidase family metallohydrolase [Vibrio parahaemolyticus]|uniref:D-Ala-D-Ala carboxypeptidase family metallohydrolase n=1 Tax=Vibrio parahaemolyticus TaxID=670 RepID=UPI0038915933